MTKKRAKQKPAPEKKRGGGLMSGMRGSMKRLAGTGGPSAKKAKRSSTSRAINIALWALVLALLVYLLVQRLG